MFVYSTSGAWKNSVDHPEFFCRGGTFIEGDRTIFRDADTPLGSYTVKFESHDESSFLGKNTPADRSSMPWISAWMNESIVSFAPKSYASSATVSRTITVLPSPFEEIIPNVTHVKASQLLTIRTAVNTVRNYYGLTAFVWTKPIVAGITEVRDWVFHITEIRTALDPVIELLQRFQCANLAFTGEPPGAKIPMNRRMSLFKAPNFYNYQLLNERVAFTPFAWLPLSSGRPNADVMNQIQALILEL